MPFAPCRHSKLYQLLYILSNASAKLISPLLRIKDWKYSAVVCRLSGTSVPVREKLHEVKNFKRLSSPPPK